MDEKEWKRILGVLAPTIPARDETWREERARLLAGLSPSNPDLGKGKWNEMIGKPFIRKIEFQDKDIIYQNIVPFDLDMPRRVNVSSDPHPVAGDWRVERGSSWERVDELPRIKKLEHFISFSKNYLDESINRFDSNTSKLPRAWKYDPARGLLPIEMQPSDESGAFYGGFNHKSIRSSRAPKELQEPPTHVIDLRGNLVPLNPSSTFKPSKKLDPYCLLEDNTRFGLPLTDVVETLSAAMKVSPLTGKELVGAVAYVAKELQGGRTVLPNQVGVLAAEAYIAGKCSGDRNPKTL